jgi:hypothetical protein
MTEKFAWKCLLSSGKKCAVTLIEDERKQHESSSVEFVVEDAAVETRGC